MSSLNRVVLVGTVARSVEVRQFDSNKVATFTVLTIEHWKNREGESHERKDYHKISAWGALADEPGARLKEGMKVCVEGRLSNRSYEKDGQKHWITEVNAQSIGLLGDDPTYEASPPPFSRSTPAASPAPPQNDGLPF